MKYCFILLSLVGALLVSCRKENPYDTNLTERLAGNYFGALDSLNSSTGITRINDTTLHFDVYYHDSTQHIRFDSVAMTGTSTFNIHGNSVYGGSGNFQGNILIFTIRAKADTTEVHKFYGNK